MQEAAQASTTKYSQGGTGATTRTVEARLRDYVSVKDFGSVGNTALQAALNASDYVFVNAGTYNGPIDITTQ